MSFFNLPEPLREPPGALLGGIRESLMASLALSVDDDDSKFIDVVDYLLSPDRDACVSDRVIQKYLTLNPEAKEHLVEMLKQLATANVEDQRFADAVEDPLKQNNNGESVEKRVDTEATLRSPRIGYVRVVGATPKAIQLLQLSKRTVEGVSILAKIPRTNDDSDYEDVAIIPNCEESFKMAEDLENNADGTSENGSSGNGGSGGSKKKKKRRKKSNKKRATSVDGELEVEVEALEEPEEADVYREMYRIDETLELFRKPLQLPEPSQTQKMPLRDLKDHQHMYLLCEHLVGNKQTLPQQQPPQQQQQAAAVVNEKIPKQTSSLETVTQSLDTSSAATFTLQSDGLFEREFKFKSVGQPETKVVTWDELRFLVSEVFPHDSELKKAFESKSQNSFELWKFVVKYGKMYKDFVSEVLEMVNELKKGLHEAMDMHREKTSEILESHKKEMCSVVEKARMAENKIDLLENELEKYQQVFDDQKVKIFGQDEELEKLRKDQTTKDKKIKDFDNVKKSLVVEKNKAKDDAKKAMEEVRDLKNQLDKEKKANEMLRGKLRRETERTEDLEYKLRELENQHYDDQMEMESLQERNNVLTYKVDDLLNEISHLKVQLADKQRPLVLPLQSAITVSEGRQRLSHSPPTEEMGSCSSFGVFTESLSSFGSKTPFSGLSSAVESPKGCSPLPTASPHDECANVANNDVHSLLSPDLGGRSFLASESRDDVFVSSDIGASSSLGNFSRTIRKGGGNQQQNSRGLPDFTDDSGGLCRPTVVQEDLNLSPAYNPWGPSSFAGFSNTSLLGSNNGCSTLFNIIPSSFGGLPNGLYNGQAVSPSLSGIDVASAPGSAITPGCPLGSDLNNNLSGNCSNRSVQNGCAKGMNDKGIFGDGGNGQPIGKRLPVRRSLDFSDLGASF